MHDGRADLCQFEGVGTLTLDDGSEEVGLDRAVAEIPEDVLLGAENRRSGPVQLAPVGNRDFCEVLESLFGIPLGAEEAVVGLLDVRARQVLESPT